MKNLRNIAGVAIIGAATLTFGQAVEAQTVLRFNNVLPPFHTIRKDGWDVWAKQVAAATKGRVKIEFTTKALGILPRAFDLGRDGVADVAWGVQSYTPGRFVSAEIVTFAFSTPSAVALSVAFWRTHQKYFAKAGEYKGLHILGVHTHSQGDLFTATKPLTKLADMKGLKMRIVSRQTNSLLRGFGGSPVREPAPKMSQLLSKGVIDGTFFTADGISSFRLGGKLKNWLRFPGGLYNTPFFLGVNVSKWNKLSEADRKAITSVSGENFAKIMGKVWDVSQAKGVALLKKTNSKIVDASAADIAKVKVISDANKKAWIASVGKRGIDGAAALKMLRSEATAYKNK